MKLRGMELTVFIVLGGFVMRFAIGDEEVFVLRSNLFGADGMFCASGAAVVTMEVV